MHQFRTAVSGVGERGKTRTPAFCIIWWRTRTIKLGDEQEEQVPDIQADGTCACQVHYLIGYCPQTIAEFRVMAEEIRKTFPEASDDKIECGKIHKSDWCYGFTIVVWTAKLKFKQNPELMERLIATGDAELIEGNTWNDTFWGVCGGKGHNFLGKILMIVRDEEAQRRGFLLEV